MKGITLNYLSILIQVTIVLGIGAIYFKLRRLNERISILPIITDYSKADFVEEKTSEIENTIALTALNLKFPIFLGGPSIDGIHARLLIQQLLSNTPRTIVELGSGSSTVLIARTMQLLGSKDHFHVSVDHDLHYLEISRRYAILNQVADNIKFAHCPLKRIDSLNKAWYADIPSTLEGRKIELLIIDGPPAYKEGQEEARSPALEVLYSHLAEKCTIILDDANRQGEREIANQWVQRYPEFRLTRTTQGKGVVVLER